jgi:hypothetical protein
MNTPASAMGDDDIRAFTRPEPPPPAPRRRRWPWLLLALALPGLVMLLALGALLSHPAQGLAGMGDWHFGIDEHGWHGWEGDGSVAGVLGALLVAGVALLVVSLVVPLVLLGVGLAVGLSLGFAALALVAALGLGLGALALVLLLLTAPLWLVGLLLWWALKPSKPAVASTPSA